METTLVNILVKIIAACAGSILSLSVLRPRNVADALSRFVAGVIGGFTAGPLLTAKFFPEALDMQLIEITFAFCVGSAFLAYFTLSAISGTISKWDTVADILATLKAIKNLKEGGSK